MRHGRIDDEVVSKAIARLSRSRASRGELS